MVNLHLCLVVNRLSKVNLFLVTLVIYLGFATLLHNYFISNRIKAAEDNHHYHDLHVQPQHQKFKPNLRKFNITNLNGGDTINNKDVPNQTKKSNEAKMRKKTKSKSSHVHHQQEEAQQSYKSIRDEWYEVIKTNPVFKSIPKSPLRVGLMTRSLKDGPTQHVFLDGMETSEYLELTYTCIFGKPCLEDMTATNTTVDLWLIDGNGVKSRAEPNDVMHQLLDIANPSFQILFVDYSDRLVPRSGFMKHHYADLSEEKFQQSHMRFAIRGIVKGRNFRNNYIALGKILKPSYEDFLYTKAGLPFHTPFAVRSDIANSIQDMLGNLTTKSTTTSPIPYHPSDCLDRPLDIIHLWEILLPSKRNDFRNLVTSKVSTMANLTHPLENERQLRVIAGLRGDRAHLGRWGVSVEYVKTLLDAKIVVVAQRDQWEDHFRLFEALSSGAMVLMDEMLSLPHTLEDGESVVFFRSLDDLQEKAMYYLEHTEERLAIARKGWEISMTAHRSWHRLEEMLFGKALTKTNIHASWIVNGSKNT